MKAGRLSATVVKKWARITQIVWLILIGIAIVLMITNQSLSFAQSGGTGADSNALKDWLKDWIPQLGIFIGLLAVVMVIIAGIVYAFDLGGGKQIGVAKDMIISAISGVILFMLASWLLNAISEIVPADPGPSSGNSDSTDKSVSGGNDEPKHVFSPGDDPLDPDIIFWLFLKRHILNSRDVRFHWGQGRLWA